MYPFDKYKLMSPCPWMVSDYPSIVCTLYWFISCVIPSKNLGILVACAFVLELKIHVLF